MSPELPDKYFTHFESKHMPKITWQEMVENRVVIAPEMVTKALKEAEHLLTTSPGPNLDRRKILAPQWFGYWQTLLQLYLDESSSDLVDSGNTLIAFENLADHIKVYYGNSNTGEIFVAGAEGHRGHIHAAKYMASLVPVTVWGFEQEKYMERKEREASFLPLELRLSMWFYEPSVTHITVLPLNTSGVPDNEHYDDLFKRSGAKYFFVHENDPYLLEKLKRGDQDLDHVIYQDFPLVSTTDAVEKLAPDVSLEEADRRLAKFYSPRVIPNLPVESTTEQVQKLLPYNADDLDLEWELKGSAEEFWGAYHTRHAGERSRLGFYDSIFVE